VTILGFSKLMRLLKALFCEKSSIFLWFDMGKALVAKYYFKAVSLHPECQQEAAFFDFNFGGCFTDSRW
jgi:hypothetical protein